MSVNQKKRHKISLARAREQIQIHTSKPPTFIEWRWYETPNGLEVFFALFSVRYEASPGHTKMYRWQVFEEGEIAAGGIVGYG